MKATGEKGGGIGGVLGRERACVVCSQVVECVAEGGVLRALRIELTPWVGLCGTQHFWSWDNSRA